MVIDKTIIFKRVLFICLGNINRSPAGELIWKREVHEKAQSAGLKGKNKPISKKMRISLINIGIDQKQVLKHRSKQITSGLMSWATVVFCMTPDHMIKIAKDFPKYRNKLELLSRVIGKKRISDPAASSDITIFENALTDIRKSIMFYSKIIFRQGRKYR